MIFYSDPFLFGLNVLYMLGCVTSMARMVIKLLQSRLYLMNICIYIMHCRLTWITNKMFTSINCEIVSSATGSDMQQWTCLHATITSILPCKGKMQYLLTLQVSRYCLLPLQSSIHSVTEILKRYFPGCNWCQISLLLRARLAQLAGPATELGESLL